MKQGLSLAFVYIGLVIGAGFASGREIMEYFNLPSGTDHSGIILATFLLVAVCYLVLRRAYGEQITTCDKYLKAVAGRFAGIIKGFLFLYLFCGFFTMLSGSGALLSQSYMLPKWVGILFLAVACFLVLSFDLRGIVAANGIMVPCMIAGILYICFSAALFGTTQVFSYHGLTKGMLTSALCYVSYNTVSAPSVLIPLQNGITPRGIRVAALVGGFSLGLLILVIWAGQNLAIDALWESELPMLKLASLAGRIQKKVYTGVLLMAICTTAISQGFGILQNFRLPSFQQRMKGAGLLCLLAIPFALIDFSTLVRHLYGFFGITGLLWMIWIFVEYWIYQRTKKDPTTSARS